MSNLIHEKQQHIITQLMDLLAMHTETISRLKSHSIDIRGFSEVDANLEREDTPRAEVERPCCMVNGDECVNLYFTPCMHIICRGCAINWFIQEGKATCPMCRHSPIVTGDLVQCPLPAAQTPAPDRSHDADSLQCRYAEYLNLVLQIHAESNVTRFCCARLMAQLRDHISELQFMMHEGAPWILVEADGGPIVESEDVDMDI